MTHLFRPLTLRGVTLPNRVGVSPMCQYSAVDGVVSDWHVVHLGSRAVGGAGLVLTEATAVEARGRISPGDLGIWSDAHVPGLARVAAFIREQGAVAGIQLAHAGRKGSHDVPWAGDKALTVEQGGWETVAPSALPFDAGQPTPQSLTVDGIHAVQQAFADATRRSLAAGFQWVELHFAHGYLAHEFLSPLSNHRTDDYGGSFANRTRFAVETVKAVRAVWPQDLPLAVRISATDWTDGGWTVEDSVTLSTILAAEGVDLVDCSSGGVVPHAHIKTGPGYQVPFAEAVRRGAGVASGAVGLITDPAQADSIIREGRADLVLLAREMLRDPYWPLHAATALGHDLERRIPVQYARAFR